MDRVENCDTFATRTPPTVLENSLFKCGKRFRGGVDDHRQMCRLCFALDHTYDMYACVCVCVRMF